MRELCSEMVWNPALFIRLWASFLSYKYITITEAEANACPLSDMLAVEKGGFELNLVCTYAIVFMSVSLRDARKRTDKWSLKHLCNVIVWFAADSIFRLNTEKNNLNINVD